MAERKTTAKKAAKKAVKKTAAKTPARKSTTAALVPTDPKMLQQARTSMINLPVGNRVYQLKRDPNCAVCTHPARGEIEERILFHEGYKSIADWASNHDAERYDGVRVPWPTIEAKQIARHYRAGHVPVDARMMHEVYQQRVGEVDYESITGRVVDHIGLAQITVARTQERAVRGEIEPGYKEGLAATKLLMDFDRSRRETEQQDVTWALEEAFVVYFEEARAIMNDEQWDRYSVRLNQNPVLQRLAERMQNPDGVIDAEIVEDNPR